MAEADVAVATAQQLMFVSHQIRLVIRMYGLHDKFFEEF